MIEFPKIIMLIFKVAAFIMFVYAAIMLVGFFMKTTVLMDISGSQAAMAHKLLAAPGIGSADFEGTVQKFMLRKQALDAYNNSEIPGMEFDGSYYFIRIKALPYTWQFTNAPDITYGANVRARGSLPADESGVGFCTNTYSTSPDWASDPFYGMNAGGNDATAITISDGETMMAGYALSIVDPDSSYSYEDYQVKYPLCICDIACPADNGCKCSPDCPTKTDVAKNEMCN